MRVMNNHFTINVIEGQHAALLAMAGNRALSG